MFTRGYYFSMDLHLVSAHEIFSRMREKPCMSTEREAQNLYFRNVMRCRCKIWNINASRHSHNRSRMNQTVRSVLFLFQCVFIVHRMVPASFPSKFSLSLSLFFCLFLAYLYTDPKWVERTQPCYYNTATSSQSLVVEVRPSFNILHSVSMSWSQSIWTAKRAAIAYRLN